VTVRLVEYPIHPTEVIRADQGVLDALADEHLGGVAGAARGDMTRFLFGDVPVRVFADLFAEGGDIDGAVARWLLHLSGYFGGRWLRSEIAAAQPDAPLVSFSVAPERAAFDAAMARAAVALAAADAAEGARLEFAHASLLGAADEAGEPAPGLVDSFGYNAGYNTEILASPPDGVIVPAALEVRCTGLLRCHYASPRLGVLAELAATADRLNDGDAEHASLAATLRPIQEGALPRGRAVWSSGLSVQGFGQRSYETLLDVSSSFLETVEATALTMVRAVVSGDARVAAVGARADAAMRVWLAAYMAGLLDGEGEVELPAFA
jgi:hypothetical protein